MAQNPYQSVVYQLLLAQVGRLYDLGIAAEVGRHMGQSLNLEEYIATFPMPCEYCFVEAEMTKGGPKEKRLWYFLVDPRAGLVVTCKAANITCDNMAEQAEPLSDRHVVPSQPYWALMHNGWINRRKEPQDSRIEFEKTPAVLAARAMDGVFGRIQCPDIMNTAEGPEGHAMILVGTVRSQVLPGTALLEGYGTRGNLTFCFNFLPFRYAGAAFLRECQHGTP